jgi:XTP/dITP diphosphohydrolase
MSGPLRLVLATGNQGKLAELRRILVAELGDRVELIGLADVPGAPEVAETGATFTDNALLKARALAEHTGLIAVADDSGITVDALNGMPGVLSARWCGRHGDDVANLELLLAQIADVPDERRGGAFVCAAVAVLPDGAALISEGVLRGRLTHAPRGSGGFGYDPIFVPEGLELTTAELSSAEKDAISHRGQAFRLLAVELAEHCG